VNEKIQKLTLELQALKNNQRLSMRRISNILSKAELLDLEQSWSEEKELRRVSKPAEIKAYQKRMKLGCIFYGKMEKYSLGSSKNTKLSLKFANKADSVFEVAIDYIQEAVRDNAELSIWLDRDVFTEASCCSAGIPRVIGSKSAECLVKQKRPYPKLSKREITIQFLEIKLRELVDDPLESLEIELPAFLRTKKLANELFSGFKF
jgi:hypothetical protein